jgi:hypothetical protein
LISFVQSGSDRDGVTRSLSHNLSLGGQYDRTIENNLHWQLDVSFREDGCRACRDHSPANLSVARRFALGLLKRETECEKGTEIKRMKCAGSDEYREKALFKRGT